VLKNLGNIIVFICLLLVSCKEDTKESVNINENNNSEPVLIGFDADMSDDIAAYKTVVNVIRETGLSQNFVILPGDVSNVKAYMDNNERILEYNPDFMANLQSRTDWYGISVLARQIGHHLSNAKFEGGMPSIKEEIKADKYAGFVLYKMGASLNEAIKAMELVILEDSLEKGISKNSRLVSLTKGWKKAKVLMSDTILITELNSKLPLGTNTIDRSSAKYKPEYLYRVFLAIEKTMYFVDDQDQVFTEVDGDIKNVGLKKNSNKLGFDWIFVKDGDSYGVDKKGKLWAFSTDGNFHVVGQSIRL